jgi:hypothetical protein
MDTTGKKPTIATATKAEILEALDSPTHPGTQRNCRWCGERFHPNRLWQEFCRPVCRNTYHNDSWRREAGTLQQRVRQLEQENDELIRECSELRKRPEAHTAQEAPDC